MIHQPTNHTACTWGNATYVDLAVGDTIPFLGTSVTLRGTEGNRCTVRIGQVDQQLTKLVRGLPTVVDGVRVFIADDAPTKAHTTDPEIHGLLQRDALLCLSNASQPLLDPDRFVFPVSRRDGYHWHMEEQSQMFAYYGEPWRPPGVSAAGLYRSHEGIDLNLHDARGIRKHPLVAIEDGVVRWVKVTNDDEACLVIQSVSMPDVHYVYQHLCNRHVFVRNGQAVTKGEELGCIWGDGVWGHLHFAVVRRESVPEYGDRYHNCFNSFPQMYELWHGDLEPRPRVWSGGHFTFGHPKAAVENKLCQSAYDDIVGYGWRIEDWCPAAAMQRHPRNSGSIAMWKTLHRGTPAECVNPKDHYDFDVRVEPGAYGVSVKVGDVLNATWQRVSVQGADLGTLELPQGQFAWSKGATVEAPDGTLTMTIHLRDADTAAGVSELRVERVER